MPTSILFCAKETVNGVAIAQELITGILKAHKGEMINVLATNGKTLRFLHEFSTDIDSLCKSLKKIEPLSDIFKPEQQIHFTLRALDPFLISRFIIFVDSDKSIDTNFIENQNLRVHYICNMIESQSITNLFSLSLFNPEEYLNQYCKDGIRLPRYQVQGIYCVRSFTHSS